MAHQNVTDGENISYRCNRDPANGFSFFVDELRDGNKNTVAMNQKGNFAADFRLNDRDQ